MPSLAKAGFFKGLSKRLREGADFLQGVLLPSPCLLCGTCQSHYQHQQLLCGDCELALPYLTRAEALCQNCALPLVGNSPYCGQCLNYPPAFSRSLIPFAYSYPLDSLIHRFKYRHKLAEGRALTNLMGEYLQACYREEIDLRLPELIIPVPLHWTRRLGRGFNQTEVMGWQLARDLGIPLASRLCRRPRKTLAQKGLSREQRQKNLRHAFELRKGADEILKGRCIALLDDVVTTSSTARALSTLLIKAGAGEVQIWALARTPEP